MSRLAPYSSSFSLGLRIALGNKTELVSLLTVYSVLMLIFSTVYAILPVEQLNVPGLTSHHLLWYFAITEVVVIAGESGDRSQLGRLIADGQLTTMMQRPHSLTGLLIARLMGAFTARATLLLAYACLLLPAISGATFALPLTQAPLLAASILLGGLLFIMLSYCLSTFEVLGPYSKPLNWIVSKFVFSFGGLFFPVAYFPPLLRDTVMLTPFPAVIATPGNFMLPNDATALITGIGIQAMWLVLMFAVVKFAELRMIRHVLVKGD